MGPSEKWPLATLVGRCRRQSLLLSCTAEINLDLREKLVRQCLIRIRTSIPDEPETSFAILGSKWPSQAQPSPGFNPKTTDSALGLLSKLAQPPQRGRFVFLGPLHTWPAPWFGAVQPKP